MSFIVRQFLGRREVNALARRTLLSTAAEHRVVSAIDGEMAQRASRPIPSEPIKTLDADRIVTALVIHGLATGLQLLTLDERIRRNAAELGFEIVPGDGATVV